MAYFTFIIPSKRDELLTESDDYYVRSLVGPKAIMQKVKEVKQAISDEGPEFILENFPLYYSILHYASNLQKDVIHKTYKDLHKVVLDLTKAIGFLLEDKSAINDELRQKYQNVIKMLVYIYIETVLLIEARNVIELKNQGVLKGRKKIANESVFNLDKRGVILALNNILQLEIGLFWDPPVVDENFTNIIAEVCYKFLENPVIKGEKEVREEIFNLIGTLVKTYNHSTMFAIRTVQMIKIEEHLIQCFTEGAKQLVEKYNAKGLIHALVCEVTEWQTDENYQDSQGARYCGQFITALAVSMPDLMLPEVLYFNKYLHHDSATLRNSVLNVITEVLIHVLNKPSLSKEESEYKEGFMTILYEHMGDISAHVRARVMQHWARLQKEDAIPKHFVNEVLDRVVNGHLHDKATLVRKNAANCVTTFLAHNSYSAELSLTKMKAELAAAENLLGRLLPRIEEAKKFKSEELEADWLKILPDIKTILKEELEKEDERDDEDDAHQLEKKEVAEIIQMYLSEGRYRDAIQTWKRSADDLDDADEENSKENIMEAFLEHMKTFFMQGLEILVGLEHGFSHGDFVLTEEDFQKYEVLRKNVEYLKGGVTFLTIIDGAIPLMKELLETQFLSDMQEAVDFFIAADQFHIDNSNVGIMAMLPLIQRNEQDRKDMIIEAFKTIYLKTDAKDMKEHCITVVNRLINFLLEVPSENLDHFELIVTEWVAKGTLDNAVIDILWQYFTKKINVSDEYCHASLELLRMAALSRRTIISKNIMLVTSIAFGDMGRKNLAFLGSACDFLSLAGRNKIDINSEKPAFKISSEDAIWTDLFNILLDKFLEPTEFYYHALQHAIEFLYQVCGKPQEICDAFLKDVMEKINEREELECFIYIRLCQLFGLVAVNHLDFLDETVYKELKRRENCRNAKNNLGVGKKKKKKSVVNSSTLNATNNNSTLNSSSAAASGNESTLEGAQADDADAEFILREEEKNTVTGQGLLAQFAQTIVNICEKRDLYNNVHLQGAAVTALIRYMLVSSEFCINHIQLLFTIFERTSYMDMKVSILVHLSDLLVRFPNIIEPWTPQIFQRLSDPSIEIRKATFFTLSGLILSDMIRAHSYIHWMVNSLIDPDDELSGMCRTFFVTLAQKENSLYNVLPDIFSHLMDSQNISDENVKSMMKFLFDLMDKQKYMENLVDRFCSKFEITEDLQQQRNIAYCLSLITYNEKALKKLHENFGMYKHLVHDSDIYAYFKSIMQGCNKQAVGKVDLKLIVAELEKCINSVFEANGDAQLMKPPPPPKSAKKVRRGARKPKRKVDSDSDSD